MGSKMHPRAVFVCENKHPQFAAVAPPARGRRRLLSLFLLYSILYRGRAVSAVDLLWAQRPHCGGGRWLSQPLAFHTPEPRAGSGAGGAFVCGVSASEYTAASSEVWIAPASFSLLMSPFYSFCVLSVSRRLPPGCVCLRPPRTAEETAFS